MTLFLGVPNRSGIDWGFFPWFVIRNDLLTWLRSCCAEHADTRVVTTATRHVMTSTDGLVYLLGDRTDSVIAKVGAPESVNFDIGQTSSKGGEMISEVYVNALSAYGAAATIYHELLHNKFRLAIDIHRTPNGNFTSAEAPYTDGGPSDADRRLMCEALSATARQFQGGFDLPD